jgi:hypothetical protein
MRDRRVWVALVALAALAAYFDALRCGFVLDDFEYIVDNRALALDVKLFWRAHLSAGTPFYRPLSTLSFALDKTLFGAWAPAYHAHNLLWHLVASLSALALARRLVGGLAAVSCALLFAVHPLHTEAVTGVVGRMEVMAAAFVLLGTVVYLRGQLVAAMGLCLCALWSKESGVVMPAVCLLLDGHARGWKPALRRAAWFVVPLGVYAALRAHAMAGALLPVQAGYFQVATPAQAFFTPVAVLGRYLKLGVWPHPLSADYAYQQIPFANGPLDPVVAATLVTIVALTVIAVRARKQLPALGLGLAWFGIALLPVSNLFLRIGVLMAERLTYLATFGLCLAAGALLGALAKRVQPRIAAAITGAIALAFTGLTLARNVDWDNPLVLWRDTVEKSPRSGLAHANLGASCHVVGDDDCARRELAIAAQLDPTRPEFKAALDQLTRPK